MKTLVLLALCCLGLQAGDLSFTISPAYQFPDTPQGQSSSVTVSIKNTSTRRVSILDVYVGSRANYAGHTPNYRVTGFDTGGHILGPSDSVPFTVNFTPTEPGLLFGFLQADYGIEQNGCVIADNGTVPLDCANIVPVSTLQGNGISPSWSITYTNNGNMNAIVPQPSATLDFGTVTPPDLSRFVFTIKNGSSAAITTPAVSLETPQFTFSAFALDISNLPSTISAGQTATFTLTFAPGQNGTANATFLVGPNSYEIQGTAKNAPDISYTDPLNRQLPQIASPIPFQLVPNTPGGNTYKFTIANNQTPTDPFTIPAISVSGDGYQLTGLPAFPIQLSQGHPISFSLTFSPTVSGTFPGTLTIGNLIFQLTGSGVVSPVPTMSFHLSQQPLTSAQQVDLTINASSPATSANIGTLAMQFTPAVSGVQNDPAVFFVDTQSRQLQVTSAIGSQGVTYKGKSLLTFQTGTTAGTITFTLTFPNTPPLTESYTVSPAAIHISSAQATRSTPNLQITVNGFDNTYTAGQLSFVFLDAKGAQMDAKPIPLDATTSFHQYFFTNDTAGGSFALQITFPVMTGDITKIASVAVTLTNSAGQASSTLTFQ